MVQRGPCPASPRCRRRRIVALGGFRQRPLRKRKEGKNSLIGVPLEPLLQERCAEVQNETNREIEELEIGQQCLSLARSSFRTDLISTITRSPTIRIGTERFVQHEPSKGQWKALLAHNIQSHVAEVARENRFVYTFEQRRPKTFVYPDAGIDDLA